MWKFLSAPGKPDNSVWLIEYEGWHPVKPVLWAMVGFLLIRDKSGCLTA
jgi:hypothetical protein